MLYSIAQCMACYPSWSANGNGVTALFYRDYELKKKLNSYFQKRWLKNVLKYVEHVRLHKTTIARKFLEDEKVTDLPHPPYPAELASCNYFQKDVSW